MRNLLVEVGTNQHVTASNKDDLIKVYGQLNEIYAQDGDDLIICSAINNKVYDGAGSDIVHNANVLADSEDPTGNDRYILTTPNGLANYWIGYQSTSSCITVNLNAGVASGSTIGCDRLIGVHYIWTSNGDDTLIGSKLSDTLQGGSGNDIIGGGYGSDDLFGDRGSDTIYGGAGADRIGSGYGGGHDWIDGGDGDDFITAVFALQAPSVAGGAGDDTIVGGRSVGDTIDGGDGNDIIRSGWGSDDVTGGTGADIFVVLMQNWKYAAKPETDVISDFTDGEDKFMGGDLTLANIRHHGINTENGLLVELPDGGGAVLIRGLSKAQIDIHDFLI